MLLLLYQTVCHNLKCINLHLNLIPKMTKRVGSREEAEMELSISDKDRLSGILEQEYRLFPEAAPQDYYKLVYQSVFGAGHLVKDPSMFEAFLMQEMSGLEGDRNMPLVQDITMDQPLYRLNLAPSVHLGIKPGTICEYCITGINRFAITLNELFPQIVDIALQFVIDHCSAKEEIEKFRNQLIINQFPLVHHSQPYRTQYTPHYRIIPGKELRELFRDHDIDTKLITA
jgi:hypothetical protein